MNRQAWIAFLAFAAKVVGLTATMGVALDLVTAHVAVEYFTVHHPHVVDSESPIVMALIWGIGASWWFGLIAAIPLWWVNCRRTIPLAQARIVAMVAKALAVTWAIMMAMLVGFYSVGSLVPDRHRGPNFEHDRRLMAVALTHMTEYVLGAIVAIVLVVRIVRLRVEGDNGSMGYE